VSCCVMMSFITAFARSDVPTVFAAVMNERRVARLSDYSRSVTAAFRAHAW
jgi:hypothetical protein